MIPSDCEGLIFDSDGVLVDSEIIHIGVERELLAELGLVYNEVTYLSRFVGLSNADFFAALESDYAIECTGAFPADFDERLIARTAPRMEAELEPITGVADLVQAFSGKIAVGSSAPIDRLSHKLTITGLASLFTPHIYSVDHVANGKPAPDLFLYAARQLKVPPAKCAVIEDSVNGVKAARAAGMFAIGFTGGGHVDAGLAQRLIANGAHCIANSHAEIAALL